MGFIKMENGSLINLEAAWAINMLESREASTTLCGTLAGAEIHSGMSYKENEIIYNRGRNGQLMDERLTPGGQIAYFEGGSGEPGELEARQWLKAIIEDGEPLVKPEQAFAVTQILEAIYKSAETGKEIIL
jgi:predicted dehydrogenase